MNAAIASAWAAKLRYRLEDFRTTELPASGEPWSIKIRCTGWRYCRDAEPDSYARIERWMREQTRLRVWLLDHSTGPEILCYGRVAEPGFGFDQRVLHLLSFILREMLKAKDAATSGQAGIEVLIRGFLDTGSYLERPMFADKADLEKWANSERSTAP